MFLLSFQVLKGIFTEILNAISIVCGFCSLGWQPNKTETQNMIAEYSDYSCTSIINAMSSVSGVSLFLLMTYCIQGTCVESWGVLYKVPHVFNLFIPQARFPCVLIVILDLCTKDAICNGYWGDKGKRSTAKSKYQ